VAAAIRGFIARRHLTRALSSGHVHAGGFVFGQCIPSRASRCTGSSPDATQPAVAANPSVRLPAGLSYLSRPGSEPEPAELDTIRPPLAVGSNQASPVHLLTPRSRQAPYASLPPLEVGVSAGGSAVLRHVSLAPWEQRKLSDNIGGTSNSQLDVPGEVIVDDR
jgi:hypothetical protein